MNPCGHGPVEYRLRQKRWNDGSGREQHGGSTSELSHAALLLGECIDAQRVDALLKPGDSGPTVAHDPTNDETPDSAGVLKYRYRDSNPGFRRERAAS